MTRVLALPVALIATSMLALAADQSQESNPDEPGAFDIEPQILKQNLDSSAAAAPDRDIARMEKRFARAKQSATGVERLWKIGVLSKMEMEQRILRVVQCESDLANARLWFCKGEVAALESRVASGENARDELAKIKATLAQLTEAAELLAAKRARP